MREYATDDLIAFIKNDPAKVVLFGAGDIGKLTHAALAQRGVHIDYFCDGRQEKIGSLYRGTLVIPPEQLSELDDDTLFFVCNNYLTSVSNKLRRMGFKKVFNCAQLLADTTFSPRDVDMPSLEIERKINWHTEECLKQWVPAEESLVLKYVDVVVTEACSMRCIDCSNLMQYYAQPKAADLDLLFRSVDRLAKCVDHVREFRVLGGEPFMIKSVGSVIARLCDHENVDKVIIYSNATIIPKGETLTSLKHPKVIVDITNYGDLSRNLRGMTSTFREHRIAFLEKTPSWTDSGRIAYRERTQAELVDVFKNCCVNDILTLLHGKLYRCPFSANGVNLNAIPGNPDDVVDVADSSKDLHSLRHEVQRLYRIDKEPLTACSYCNGRDYRTPKIPAAIQVRSPLPVPAPHDTPG